jgi:hypothetical protein
MKVWGFWGQGRWRSAGLSVLLFFCSLSVGIQNSQAAEADQTSSPSPQLSREKLPQVTSLLGFPRYQLHRPEWAFQFSFSPRAFSGQGLSPAQGTNPTYAYQLLFEYQPAFLQGFGVLGFGPSARLYSFPNANVTANTFSVYSYGGQIRYQARYFREQVVVPMVAYTFEILSSEFIDPSSGSVSSKDKRAQLQGPSFGAWILLNFLDRSSANSLYLNTGITRTYLTFEAKKERGTVSRIPLNLWSYFVGLRLEL